MQVTDRQKAIKARLDKGMGAREIADDLGITRNAVYQQIQRLRRNGVIASDYTPTGQPVRESRPGADVLERLVRSQSSDTVDVAEASTRALALELQRVRDELDAITQRLSTIIPR